MKAIKGKVNRQCSIDYDIIKSKRICFLISDMRIGEKRKEKREKRKLKRRCEKSKG